MATRKLETCIGNRPFGSEELLSRASTTFEGLHITEWGCLGNCHRCYRVPFALLDEYTLLEAPTQEELWVLVQSYFAQNP
ncbi:MAG: DUF1450 domain-containing protein [Firmicutes bacterium]|nr:DUF1450 domain-containing protein [Bacillota bacterium]